MAVCLVSWGSDFFPERFSDGETWPLNQESKLQADEANHCCLVVDAELKKVMILAPMGNEASCLLKGLMLRSLLLRKVDCVLRLGFRSMGYGPGKGRKGPNFGSPFTQSLDVPSGAVGFIIGKRGAMIKALQAQVGIDFVMLEENQTRCRIGGTCAGSVKSVKDQVQALINKSYQPPDRPELWGKTFSSYQL